MKQNESASPEPEAIQRDLRRFAHYREMYHTRADTYEMVRSRRDHEGRILPALNRIRPMAGLDVLESGAGSGHLTTLLAPLARSLCAYDVEQPLLDIAETKLRATGRANWTLGLADHRRLPVDDASFDVALAGYSLCHLVDENLENWREEVNKAVEEMTRALRPNGTIILLESLGRGGSEPRPARHLVEYLRYLEVELGFRVEQIRTDYRFDSPPQVQSLVRESFGDELADSMLAERSLVLPAWTGLYWRQVQPPGIDGEIRRPATRQAASI